MKFEIKSRWNGAVLFSIETDSLKLAVEAAVKSRAYLSGAYLSGADLSRAYLSGADLSGAYLSGADLSRANLSRADLSGAYLSRAYLSGANLSGADLRETKNADLILARTLIVPDGPVFGWKKCRDNVLVKLFIPSKARRSNASGRKCRAERAKVLEVIGAEQGISIYSDKLVYEVGKWVHCDKWNDDRWTECGGGIHFYITRIEAENHT